MCDFVHVELFTVCVFYQSVNNFLGTTFFSQEEEKVRTDYEPTMNL